MNLYQLIKLVEDEKNNALSDSGDEPKGIEVIRAGMNFGKEFWENFMSLCSNNESMSELLDVPKHKISRFPSKIKELINRVERHDNNDGEKSKMISTGKEPDTSDISPRGQSETEADLAPTP